MRKIFSLLNIEDKKINKAITMFKKFSLVLALIATMILSFYISTYTLFEFNLGLLLLKLSLVTYSSSIICALGFSKTLKDIE